MKKSIISNGLVLTAFAVCVTAVIALTFWGTKEQIQQQQMQKRLDTLNAIIPQSTYTNEIQLDCITISDESRLGSLAPHTVFRARDNQQPTALAIEATAPNGYSGKIELIVGLDSANVITGVRVLNHKETPGLGDKIDLRVSDWITSFNGKTVTDDNLSEWKVKKDGGNFDQFTGATITPRAVVSAVKETVLYVEQNRQALFEQPATCVDEQVDVPVAGDN